MAFGSLPTPLGRTPESKESRHRRFVSKRQKFNALRASAASFVPPADPKAGRLDVVGRPTSLIAKEHRDAAITQQRRLEAETHLARLQAEEECRSKASDFLLTPQVVKAEALLASIGASSGPASAAAGETTPGFDDFVLADDDGIDGACGTACVPATSPGRSIGLVVANTPTRTQQRSGPSDNLRMIILPKLRKSSAAARRRALSAADFEFQCEALDALTDVIEAELASSEFPFDLFADCITYIAEFASASTRTNRQDVEVLRRSAALVGALIDRFIRVGLPATQRKYLTVTACYILAPALQLAGALRSAKAFEDGSHPATEALLDSLTRLMVLDATTPAVIDDRATCRTPEQALLPRKTILDVFIGDLEPRVGASRMRTIVKLIQSVAIRRASTGREDDLILSPQCLGVVARTVTQQLHPEYAASHVLAVPAVELASAMSLVKCDWTGTRTFVRLLARSFLGIAPGKGEAEREPTPQQLGIAATVKLVAVASALGLGASTEVVRSIRGYVREEHATGTVKDDVAQRALAQLSSMKQAGKARDRAWAQRLSRASPTMDVPAEQPVPSSTPTAPTVLVRLQRSDPFEPWGIAVSDTLLLTFSADGSSPAHQAMLSAERVAGTALVNPMVVAVDGSPVADSASARAAMFGKLSVALHVCSTGTGMGHV